MIFKRTGRRLLGNKSHYDVGGSVQLWCGQRSGTNRADKSLVKMKFAFAFENLFWSHQPTVPECQKCHATKVWSKARGKNCFFLWPPAPRSGAQRWILIRQVHNDVSLCCAENIHNISCLLLARTRSTLLAHCFCLKRLILMRPYSVRLLFWSFFLGFHTRKVFSGAQNTVSKFASTLL